MNHHRNRLIFAVAICAAAGCCVVAEAAARKGGVAARSNLPPSGPKPSLAPPQDRIGSSASAKTAAEYREQGVAKYHRSRFHEAVTDLSKALELDSSDERARPYRSYAWLALGSYAEALDDANALVRNSPQDCPHRWLRLRGYVYLHSGEYERAVTDYSDAIRLGSTAASVYRERGIAQFELGHRQAALADLGRAVQLAPNDYDSYEARAFIHAVAGDWGAALADWNALVKLKPSSAHFLAKRALIHGLRGEHGKAAADHAAAARIDKKEAGDAYTPMLLKPSAAPQDVVPAAPLSPENVLAEFDLTGYRRPLIVPVRVGDRTLQFWLDTGCTFTSFDQSLRPLLGAERGRRSVGTSHGSIRIRNYDPPSLSLGALTVELTAPVQCIDLSLVRMAMNEPIDGILGLDILSQFVVRIDVSGQKVYFLRSAEDETGVSLPLIQTEWPADPGSALPDTFYHTVKVSASLPNGRTVPLMIDTGYLGKSLSVQSDVFKDLSERKQIIRPEETGSFTLSGIHNSRDGVLTAFTLGDFRHQHLDVSEKPTGNLLGLQYLSRYVATFDFPQRRLFLKPSPDFSASEAKLKLLSDKPWKGPSALAGAGDELGTQNRLVELDPASASAFISRGGYWVSQKKYDKAIEDYTAAIRLDPDDSNALYYRASARGKQGKYAEAISDLSAAIKIDADWTDAYIKRAWAATKLDDFDSAIADYTAAINIDPRSEESFYGRGWSWDGKGDFDRAIQDYTQAINLYPQYATAFVNRGVVWRKKGNSDKAIEDETAAIRLNPSDTLAYLVRGVSWAEKGNGENALLDFSEAIRLNPTDAEPFFVRGQIYQHQLDYAKAVEDFTAAIQRGYPDSRVYFHRGMAWFEQGDYQKALNDADEALKIKPKDDEAAYLRNSALTGSPGWRPAVPECNASRSPVPRTGNMRNNRAEFLAAFPDVLHRDDRRAAFPAE